MACHVAIGKVFPEPSDREPGSVKVRLTFALAWPGTVSASVPRISLEARFMVVTVPSVTSVSRSVAASSTAAVLLLLRHKGQGPCQMVAFCQVLIQWVALKAGEDSRPTCLIQWWCCVRLFVSRTEKLERNDIS